MILCLKILCGVSEMNALLPLKSVSFVKDVSDFEKPENVPTLIALDDLMVSAYSRKGIEFLRRGRLIVTLV